MYCFSPVLGLLSLFEVYNYCWIFVLPETRVGVFRTFNCPASMLVHVEVSQATATLIIYAQFVYTSSNKSMLFLQQKRAYYCKLYRAGQQLYSSGYFFQIHILVLVIKLYYFILYINALESY